jgi:hypothetical protein
MRLLSEQQQQFIWDHLFEELTRSSFPFLLSKENLRTIDGKSEAYYAVIATNFIAGRIGVDLMFVSSRNFFDSLLTDPTEI